MKTLSTYVRSDWFMSVVWVWICSCVVSLLVWHAALAIIATVADSCFLRLPSLAYSRVTRSSACDAVMPIDFPSSSIGRSGPHLAATRTIIIVDTAGEKLAGRDSWRQLRGEPHPLFTLLFPCSLHDIAAEDSLRQAIVLHPGEMAAPTQLTLTQQGANYEDSGIRYAQPPVGFLRFRKPLSPDPEPDKVFSAVQKPDACYQVIDTMFQASPGAQMWQPNTPLSEDCLYLNIWVPILPEEQRCEKDKKLPVMVWIFGGSFSTGSSVLNVYDGRFLSTRQNVIVVTLNYRLGPFGFLYLNYSGAPGNMGLWDQRLAIKWVKDHIEHFNGDPDRITLFGESAGSVSVSAHVISPWSHSFFRNAILQSGSVFGYWGVETAQKQLNQSLRILTSAEIGLLYKGTKFSHTDAAPTKFLAGLASGLRTSAVLEDMRADIRSCVTSLLQQKEHHQVLPIDEEKGLITQKTDDSILIVSADKVGATVIIEKTDYINKANQFFKDREAYTALAEDPTKN
ncbi:unnamed protein product [Schistocephalus solidus]|uniref:COesterase domain-containing protein n=1 Tax=Schistocephalus solidus TaxID=70667 RepID=A0A183SDA5_SCHSO|nr:unnamed protein product [Schistocephalus solidus]